MFPVAESVKIQLLVLMLYVQSVSEFVSLVSDCPTQKTKSGQNLDMK